MLTPFKWCKKAQPKKKNSDFTRSVGQRPIRRWWDNTPEVRVLLRGKTEAQGMQGASTKTWKMLDEDFAYQGINFFLENTFSCYWTLVNSTHSMGIRGEAAGIYFIIECKEITGRDGMITHKMRKCMVRYNWYLLWNSFSPELTIFNNKLYFQTVKTFPKLSYEILF